MTHVAFLLTWRTYGSWLHGDTRGSVDSLHNSIGSPLVEPSRRRHEHAKFLMKHPEVTLSEPMRSIVESAIRDHATKRNWRLPALNVRSNHVHLCVTGTGEYKPELVMQQFKSWATRRLIGEGMASRGVRVWADHGSTRWINDDESLASAIDYVLNWQD